MSPPRPAHRGAREERVPEDGRAVAEAGDGRGLAAPRRGDPLDHRVLGRLRRGLRRHVRALDREDQRAAVRPAPAGQRADRATAAASRSSRGSCRARARTSCGRRACRRRRRSAATLASAAICPDRAGRSAPAARGEPFVAGSTPEPSTGDSVDAVQLAPDHRDRRWRPSPSSRARRRSRARRASLASTSAAKSSETLLMSLTTSPTGVCDACRARRCPARRDPGLRRRRGSQPARLQDVVEPVGGGARRVRLQRPVGRLAAAVVGQRADAAAKLRSNAPPVAGPPRSVSNATRRRRPSR